ncbi:MAG: cytochrome c peroxidase [Pseudomonadota bacterium]
MLWTLRLAACSLAATTGLACAQAMPNEPIRPLPKDSGADPARAALGRVLFNDLRLSRDNTQSCASCHQAARGGADSKPLSAGPGGILTAFNTPTVYNSTLNVRQMWTGRHSGIDALLGHAMGPGGDGRSNWALVASRLIGDDDIGARFQRALGSDISADGVKDALGHYLRSLQTPSRFDRYLRGELNAIDADEKAGYAKFKGYGCVACHQGINVGGNMYQKLGAMRELAPSVRAAGTLGRYSVTGREADRYMVRVPSLRNVALTAPYLHNGSVATLEEAVDAMFKYQLGRSASPQDRAQIVRFLHTLTGETLPAPGAAR